MLLYLTGGAAFGGVKDSLSYSDWSDHSADALKSGAKMGYVLGGGVEYAITRNWTAKLEYQYIDFGDETLSRNESRFGGPSEYVISSKIRTAFHTVRLGVNYKF